MEAPVQGMLAELRRRKLQPADQEDEGDSAVDDAVLGADDTPFCGHIYFDDDDDQSASGSTGFLRLCGPLPDVMAALNREQRRELTRKEVAEDASHGEAEYKPLCDDETGNLLYGRKSTRRWRNLLVVLPGRRVLIGIRG